MSRVLAGWLILGVLALLAPLIAAEPVPSEEPSADKSPAAVNNASFTPAATPEETASATSLATSIAQSPPITLVLKADLGAQHVTVVENGEVVHTWPISSGVQGYLTPTGIFQPQWASRLWYSRQWGYAPMPHAVFFNSGVAFHGTTAIWRLGKSASHGCLRLSPTNAKELFNLVHKHGFAQTRVIVFGTPKHGAPPPASAANHRSPRRDGSFAAKAPPSKGPGNAGLPEWAKFMRY
jgi:lipoprotein-anchoring transpeptidase ErfK/SrfK